MGFCVLYCSVAQCMVSFPYTASFLLPCGRNAAEAAPHPTRRCSPRCPRSGERTRERNQQHEAHGKEIRGSAFDGGGYGPACCGPGPDFVSGGSAPGGGRARRPSSRGGILHTGDVPLASHHQVYSPHPAFYSCHLPAGIDSGGRPPNQKTQPVRHQGAVQPGTSGRAAFWFLPAREL